MATSISRKQVLALYKSMISESQRIPAYNFRNYALRRVRDAFRLNKNIADANLILNCVKEGQQSLEIIKRQAIIGNMFSTEKLIIERLDNHN